MSYNRNDTSYFAFGCCVSLLIYVVIPIIISVIENKAWGNLNVLYILLLSYFCLSIIYIWRNYKLNCINKENTNHIERLKREYTIKEKKLLDDITVRENRCQEKESKIRMILDSEMPFSLSSSLRSDMELYIFDDAANYLRFKQHPAWGKAREVESILKAKNKEANMLYKEMLYKYEFLLNAFPDIRNYIDKEEELISMAKDWSYANCEDSRDRAYDYLSKEEWNRLSTVERNQLALDRYVNSRKKSDWAVGRDYEMSCAHVLKQKGYEVEMHGIENGVHDLGRDLIAYQAESLSSDTDLLHVVVYVIQCKYWGKDHQIRENVIMQLYGSAVAYMVENRNMLGDGLKVEPVLMIPSFTTLSDTAIRFAEYLKIKIWRLDMENFPRIKCNINGTSKIYHLPFDQQYDRAQIKYKGEAYAYTVAEAENAGFRRAKRHVIE